MLRGQNIAHARAYASSATTIEQLFLTDLSTGTAQMILKVASLRSILAKAAHRAAVVCREVLHGCDDYRTRARYAMSCACLTLVIVACAGATLAKAQSNQAPAGKTEAATTYDKLLDEAVTAFDASDFSRARSFFSKAYELRPNARVLRGLGIAALRLERYSEAYRTLSLSLKHPVQTLTQSQNEEVTGLLSWMETSLGCIRLRWSPSEPADFELLVDDGVLKESTMWLSPGTHRVAVHAPGFGTVERTITLAPEQHEVIELTMSARKREPVKIANAETVTVKPSVRPVDAAQSLQAQQPEAPAPAALQPGREAAKQTAGRHVDSTSDGGSVFTRWWFWTAVAVVVAGGVTTAVLLSTPTSTRPLDTNSSVLVVLP